MTLPTLKKFSGDRDAFDHWFRKFSHYAELEQWTERQKLLQLVLYLSGRAEQVYEVLPASAKDTFSRAIESLKKRLQPVANEALLLSQLMRRKQRTEESVSTYTPKNLRHYSRRAMVRGKGWISPLKNYLRGICSSRDYPSSCRRKSAATFADALHQARAAEEQDTLLGELHRGRPPDKPLDKQPPSRSSSQNQSVGERELERVPGLRTSNTRRGVRQRRCYICHSLQH